MLTKKLKNKNYEVFFDTSALFNFYDFDLLYSEEILKNLIELSNKEIISISITEQVYREYLINRDNVINKKIKNLKNKKKDLSNDIKVSPKLKKIGNKYIDCFKSDVSFQDNDLKNKYNDFKDALDRFQDAKSAIEKKIKKQYDNRCKKLNKLNKSKDIDKLHQFINLLKDLNKVQGEYHYENFKSWVEEANVMKNLTILPGFGDDLNKNVNSLGDYINYKQILEYGKKTQKNIIFITNDKKENYTGAEYDFAQTTHLDLEIINLNKFTESMINILTDEDSEMIENLKDYTRFIKTLYEPFMQNDFGYIDTFINSANRFADIMNNTVRHDQIINHNLMNNYDLLSNQYNILENVYPSFETYQNLYNYFEEIGLQSKRWHDTLTHPTYDLYLKDDIEGDND